MKKFAMIGLTSALVPDVADKTELLTLGFGSCMNWEGDNWYDI